MIKVTELISKALKEGIDFGKGQIETRVHYLTRMGILPGAIRKQEKDGSLAAYYPEESVEILRRVAQYQREGYNLTQIKLLLGRPAFAFLPTSHFPFQNPASHFPLPTSVNAAWFLAGIFLVLTLLQLPYTYRSLTKQDYKDYDNYKNYNVYNSYKDYNPEDPDEIIYLPVAYKNLQKIKDVNFTIK